MSQRTSMDDLIRLAQSGDHGYVRRLFTELRPRVCRWAVIWTGSTDIAEDVAQSVLLRIHSALPAYKAKGQAMTWAHSFGKAEKSLTAESWTKMGAWLGVADFGTSVRSIPQLSIGDEGLIPDRHAARPGLHVWSLAHSGFLGTMSRSRPVTRATPL
ncbi:MAG: sigma factor [Longimicrobiales bacterium]|nr:sigma factor [Longimicrobiales bacterium]